MADAESTPRKMAIFRAADAPKLMESGCMTIAPVTPEQREGINKAVAAGYTEGDEVRVLCNLPGFNLTHAWLKAGYPLALHTHDSDCLYYVVAGSLKLGTEQLGPKDTFLIPAGVPYTYTPGPDGVEVLEFRHATEFNFVNLSKNPAFWERATQSVAANREGWAHATPPSERV